MCRKAYANFKTIYCCWLCKNVIPIWLISRRVNVRSFGVTGLQMHSKCNFKFWSRLTALPIHWQALLLHNSFTGKYSGISSVLFPKYFKWYRYVRWKTAFEAGFFISIVLSKQFPYTVRFIWDSMILYMPSVWLRGHDIVFLCENIGLFHGLKLMHFWSVYHHILKCMLPAYHNLDKSRGGTTTSSSLVYISEVKRIQFVEKCHNLHTDRPTDIVAMPHYAVTTQIQLLHSFQLLLHIS